MTKTIEQFINDYVEGQKEYIDEIVSNDLNNTDIVIAIDYLDEIEDAITQENIEVSAEQLQEIKNQFVSAMQKEYGEDNVYINAPSHTVPVDGNFKTVYGQMAIVIYKSC